MNVLEKSVRFYKLVVGSGLIDIKEPYLKAFCSMFIDKMREKIRNDYSANEIINDFKMSEVLRLDNVVGDLKFIIVNIEVDTETNDNKKIIFTRGYCSNPEKINDKERHITIYIKPLTAFNIVNIKNRDLIIDKFFDKLSHEITHGLDYVDKTISKTYIPFRTDIPKEEADKETRLYANSKEEIRAYSRNLFNDVRKTFPFGLFAENKQTKTKFKYLEDSLDRSRLWVGISPYLTEESKTFIMKLLLKELEQ
jgi:hypothetical protein